MSRDFFKPPCIERRSGYRGISAEGDAVGDDLTTFELAVQSYGYMVPLGVALTGGQWIHRIAKQYDCNEPRNAAIVAAISRVMKCDQFADDYLVVEEGEGGSGLFRGTSAAATLFLSSLQRAQGAPGVLRPVAACAERVVAQADLANAQRDANSLGAKLVPVDASEQAPPHFYAVPGYKVVPGAEGDLMSRMLRLLNHAPVGKESYLDEENDDFEAQCELAARLTQHMGYAHLVTSGAPGSAPCGGKAREKQTPFEADEFTETLGAFVGGLVERGWTPEKAVFLCRPAPVVGSPFSEMAFESVVHPELVGFRLPKAMVVAALERHQEKSAMGLRARQSN